MIVGIRVESLKPKTGEVKHTNSCYFTMVAKDDDGKPMTVPKLILENEDDVRRFYDAIQLRKKRQEISSILSKDIKKVSLKTMKSIVSKNRCQVNL